MAPVPSPVPVVGLGSLCLGSDCSDAESEADRDSMSCGLDSEGATPRQWGCGHPSLSRSCPTSIWAVPGIPPTWRAWPNWASATSSMSPPTSQTSSRRMATFTTSRSPSPTTGARTCRSSSRRLLSSSMRPCPRTAGCSSTAWRGSAVLSPSLWPTSCRSSTSLSTMPMTWSRERSLTSPPTSTSWGSCWTLSAACGWRSAAHRSRAVGGRHPWPLTRPPSSPPPPVMAPSSWPPPRAQWPAGGPCPTPTHGCPCPLVRQGRGGRRARPEQGAGGERTPHAGWRPNQRAYGRAALSLPLLATVTFLLCGMGWGSLSRWLSRPRPRPWVLGQLGWALHLPALPPSGRVCLTLLPQGLAPSPSPVPKWLLGGEEFAITGVVTSLFLHQGLGPLGAGASQGMGTQRCSGCLHPWPRSDWAGSRPHIWWAFFFPSSPRCLDGITGALCE
uniref:Uncharacterized protein n=1 Tax=Macaca fascicularis TaxID=9541 RepID=A0A7N9D460_MACFA